MSYFKSESDEIIFYLLETDGKLRMRKLDVTDFNYENKEYAKKWRDGILNKIDKDHPKAAEAIGQLDSIFNIMIDC
jgi:hypothetical protein